MPVCKIYRKMWRRPTTHSLLIFICRNCRPDIIILIWFWFFAFSKASGYVLDFPHILTASAKTTLFVWNAEGSMADTDSKLEINHFCLPPACIACVLISSVGPATLGTAYTVSKKRHPFHFCDIFVKFYPILLLFGRNMPQEIWNKHVYMLNSYLVLYVRTVPCKN